MRGLKRSILIFTCCLLVGCWYSLDVSNVSKAVRPVARAAGREMPLKGGKFPHAQSGKQALKGHRDLACSECHLIAREAPYEVTGKPSPKLNTNVVSPFPGHASCVNCHNFALMSFVKPAFCGICHAENPQSPQDPGLFKQFQTDPLASDFGIGFSHIEHRLPLPSGLTLVAASKRGPSLAQAALQLGKSPLCTDCHARASTPPTVQPEYLVETGHPVCFTCHQQQPVGLTTQSQKPFPAVADCQGCHTLTDPQIGRERAPRLFQTAKVKDFLHFEHELDTRSVKKSEARNSKARDYLCSECHSAVVQAASLTAIKAPSMSSCLACHNDKRKPGLPEPLSLAVRRSLREGN